MKKLNRVQKLAAYNLGMYASQLIKSLDMTPEEFSDVLGDLHSRAVKSLAATDQERKRRGPEANPYMAPEDWSPDHE